MADFTIAALPVNAALLQQQLPRGQAGACVTFEGWVRDQNEGMQVTSLEYEAYIPLAEKEGTEILTEARAKFGLTAAVAVHRIGHLELGEVAVWVGTAAPHRGAAFDACRYIIDEAKARMPIWKKEHYASGSSAWINCATRGHHATATHPGHFPGSGKKLVI